MVDKKFMSHLNNVTGKIRSRRSVTDMKRLQGMLEETTSNGSLKEKINRTAASDKNFDSFLQDFREKHKGQVNILDFTRFYDENNRLKNDEKLRQDEIDMLKEFMARNKDREKKENQIVGLELIRQKNLAITMRMESICLTEIMPSIRNSTLLAQSSCM